MFSDDERAVLASALDALVPGCAAAGAVDYVEGLLGAFDVDPPRVWAAPGGGWLELGPWEAAAWRARIAGWREVYARVL
ncbi:MAG: hypothetical protein ACRDPR_24115, partial [Nocardioidaceae bacterium]